ncbi:hypothetical protein KAFR_0B00370 [Kazachstania africana CBS 2517]|uniref:Uncharacterized protein n=1 Tax=Kazachstania africana (strain ATCC 22294 / BCRC 22015 / CBS 2517 / CECT 1963 / NBRC 1671 / NRRL Y-8276) TaxID=1071382 RepID=H2APN7_KAZAF|nr:hypothetical protein KAFR_0B00370 [Kazachstania africana CBS 2517]CCF56337.1 hypothetical protein KAFR_0B00370 [Kazachstania africana CBS 2517]
MVELDDIRIDNEYKGIDGKQESVNDALQDLELQREKLEIVANNDDDQDVRNILNFLGQAEILNSKETTEARRNRLAELVASRTEFLTVYEEYKKGGGLHNEEEDEEEEEFYTPASEELVKARRFLVKYSINKSKERLRSEKERALKASVKHEINKRRVFNKELQNFELSGSQVASIRPISKIAIAPNDEVFATGDWNGDLKLFNSKTLEPTVKIDNVHSGKIGGLDWNKTGGMLVTGAEDGMVKLYSYTSNEIKETTVLKGHEKRVVATKFHPSTRFLGSTSFDTTWRLWDIATSQELLLQEGHSKEVYSLSFQGDGSLVCTGGLDNTALLWDIRCGKSIMTLNGHSKPVYCVDWSCNGYNVATGGGDGLINIWDIRKTNLVNTILAHNNIISDLRFAKQDSKCLVSCSYDKKINIYSSDNWLKVKTLEGHSHNILSVDMTNNAKALISGGWDRSVKLWHP